MKKAIVGSAIFAIVCFLICLIILWRTAFENNSDSCEIYCERYETPLDALIRTVKENDENCGKYTLFNPETDSYGQKVWQELGYYNLNELQWEELRKYKSAYYFLQVYDKQPKFYPNKPSDGEVHF